MKPYQNYGIAVKLYTIKGNSKMTYYDHEFKKLGDMVQVDLKLQSFNGDTRWMTVSADKVKAILAILNIDEEEINK